MGKIVKGAWMKLGAPLKSKKKKKKLAAKTNDLIYQLKVVLKGSKPSIWRRVLVHGGTRLDALHAILQIAMGWEDCHLHFFEIDGVCYAPPDMESSFDDSPKKAKSISLKTAVPLAKTRFKYEYDMGDGWLHSITVEKILPADRARKVPGCVAGEGACPPEDCGGLWGYYAMLEALTDKRHPDYDRAVNWLGDNYNADHFDRAAVNAKLNAWH